MARRFVQGVALHLQVHGPGDAFEGLAHAARAHREQDGSAVVLHDEREVRDEPQGLREHRRSEIAQRIQAPRRVALQERSNLALVGQAGHQARAITLRKRSSTSGSRSRAASGLQDLPNRIGQQLRPELPACLACRTIVVVDRHLRHRCRLWTKRARRYFGVDVLQRGAALRTRGRGRLAILFLAHRYAGLSYQPMLSRRRRRASNTWPSGNCAPAR